MNKITIRRGDTVLPSSLAHGELAHTSNISGGDILSIGRSTAVSPIAGNAHLVTLEDSSVSIIANKTFENLVALSSAVCDTPQNSLSVVNTQYVKDVFSIIDGGSLDVFELTYEFLDPEDQQQFSQAALDEIHAAIDYWGNVLANNTTISAYHIYILTDDDPTSNALAYAAPYNLIYVPGTKYHMLPIEGYVVFNTNYIASSLANVTPGGRTELFNIAVHELGHAFGLGTMWWMHPQTTSQYSALDDHWTFVVKAGDDSTNSTYTTAGNIFYTTTRGNNTESYLPYSELSAKIIDAYNEPLPSNPLWLAGVAVYDFAKHTTKNDSSSAVAAYNQAFNTNLSAIPLENGMVAGSYGGHWEEGEPHGSDGMRDNRHYHGNLIPGAPGLHNEIMTAVSESSVDMPISKITLGAMADLGWEVDMAQADVFEPLKHHIRYSTSNPSALEVRNNNFGGYRLAFNGVNYNIFQTLRAGLTYTFYNQTGENLLLIEHSSNNIINQNIVTGVEDGVPFFRWSIPIAYANNFVWIVGSGANANIPWFIF